MDYKEAVAKYIQQNCLQEGHTIIVDSVSADIVNENSGSCPTCDYGGSEAVIELRWRQDNPENKPFGDYGYFEVSDHSFAGFLQKLVDIAEGQPARVERPSLRHPLDMG